MDNKTFEDVMSVSLPISCQTHQFMNFERSWCSSTVASSLFKQSCSVSFQQRLNNNKNEPLDCKVCGSADCLSDTSFILSVFLSPWHITPTDDNYILVVVLVCGRCPSGWSLWLFACQVTMWAKETLIAVTCHHDIHRWHASWRLSGKVDSQEKWEKCCWCKRQDV